MLLDKWHVFAGRGEYDLRCSGCGETCDLSHGLPGSTETSPVPVESGGLDWKAGREG